MIIRKSQAIFEDIFQRDNYEKSTHRAGFRQSLDRNADFLEGAEDHGRESGDECEIKRLLF